MNNRMNNNPKTVSVALLEGSHMPCAASPTEGAYESAALDRWTRLQATWSFLLAVAFFYAIIGWSTFAILTFGLACVWRLASGLRRKYWYRRWRAEVSR
jgi:hypothetical protein